MVWRVLLMMSLVSAMGWAQDPKAKGADPAVEEIRVLEQERNTAIVKGDAATLNRMTSDD